MNRDLEPLRVEARDCYANIRWTANRRANDLGKHAVDRLHHSRVTGEKEDESYAFVLYIASIRTIEIYETPSSSLL